MVEEKNVKKMLKINAQNGPIFKKKHSITETWNGKISLSFTSWPSIFQYELSLVKII